jgi:hypothetical protein
MINTSFDEIKLNVFVLAEEQEDIIKKIKNFVWITFQKITLLVPQKLCP